MYRRLVSIVIATSLGACGEPVLAPADQTAPNFEGSWVSTDSLETSTGRVGVMYVTLRATPEAFWSHGGRWSLGGRSGDVTTAFVLPGDSLSIYLSGDASIHGSLRGDVISGVIDGGLSGVDSSTGDPAEEPWEFMNLPVTLTRRR